MRYQTGWGLVGTGLVGAGGQILFAAHDAGHFEEVAVAIGGAVEDCFAVGVGFLVVFAGDVAGIDRAGGGLDAGGVEFTQLLDVVQDAADLAGKLGFFLGGEGKAGEEGDFVDLGLVNHGIGNGG